MKMFKAFVAALAAVLAFAAPAHAVEGDGGRVATTTDLRIQPASSYTFHNGDPIKVCIMVTTDQRVEHDVTVAIDQRGENAGKWHTLYARIPVNARACIIATMRVADGDSGTLLRAHALRNRVTDRSMSHTLHVKVAS